MLLKGTNPAGQEGSTGKGLEERGVGARVREVWRDSSLRNPENTDSDKQGHCTDRKAGITSERGAGRWREKEGRGLSEGADSERGGPSRATGARKRLE